MASSEKRKLKSDSDKIRNSVSGLPQAPLIQPQKVPMSPEHDRLTGTRFDSAAAHSPITNSDLSPLSSLPAELDGDKVFAFYPSGAHPDEADRPTLVDAVIEQLRQARLRRLRPH